MESHTTEIYFGNSRYCRTRSIQREQLEHKLLEYYGVATHNPGKNYVSFVFSSGMSAISTVMQSLSNSQGSIVLGDELYCDSPKVAKYLVQKGFYKSVILLSELKETDNIRLIHLETCSNPSGNIPDYERLIELKKKHNCIISLDNTWLSGASFNPISRYGDLVDVVIESSSKYLSNGKCIGGICVSKEVYSNDLFNHIRMYGLHVPQGICEALTKSITSVEERISTSSKKTEDVVKELRKRYNVTYPESADCKYKPSVMVVSVEFPNVKLGNPKRMDRMRENIKKMCEEVNLPFETSFGSSYSKIDTFPKISNDKASLNIRVYIGYDNDQDRVLAFFENLVVNK